MKQYCKPEVGIVRLEQQDVICRSGGFGEGENFSFDDLDQLEEVKNEKTKTC